MGRVRGWTPNRPGLFAVLNLESRVGLPGRPHGDAPVSFSVPGYALDSFRCLATPTRA